MTPTPEMIEAAARAICINNGADPDGQDSDIQAGMGANWNAYEGDAREALKAVFTVARDEEERTRKLQSYCDDLANENGELKLAVARLQVPEFYGTENTDIGTDRIESLFDFCDADTVLEIDGYRHISTQYGIYDGTTVHLFNNEGDALDALKRFAS